MTINFYLARNRRGAATNEKEAQKESNKKRENERIGKKS